MFNWFSLDYIYYPVSGIMWLWYKLFAVLLGPENFFAWALSFKIELSFVFMFCHIASLFRQYTLFNRYLRRGSPSP